MFNAQWAKKAGTFKSNQVAKGNEKWMMGPRLVSLTTNEPQHKAMAQLFGWFFESATRNHNNFFYNDGDMFTTW